MGTKVQILLASGVLLALTELILPQGAQAQAVTPARSLASDPGLPPPTSTQDVIESNPIKLYISKEAPSFELPKINGSYGLDDSIKIGLKNNLTLKQVEQDTFATQFLKRGALARFGPQASFNSFYSTSSLNQMLFYPSDSTVMAGPMQPIVRGTSLSLLFAATQPIFTGGRLLGGYRAARAVEKQSIYSFAAAKNLTTLKIREAYWNSAWAEAKLKVDSDYVKSKEWSAANIKARMDQGKVPRADYLRELAELARARKQVNADFAVFNVALVKLKTAIGLNYSSLFYLKDELEYKPTPGSMEDYLVAAGKNRPEIARALNKVAELKARRLVARSKFAPQVSAYGVGSNISGSSPDGTASGRWGGFIGIVGGITLFDAGVRANELHAADTAVKQAEIALTEAKQKVAEDVSVAWIDLEFNRRNVDEAKAEVISAEEDHRLLHARYLAAKSIALEDFDAAVKLLQARLSLLQAIYEYRLAEARLLFAAAANEKH